MDETGGSNLGPIKIELTQRRQPREVRSGPGRQPGCFPVTPAHCYSRPGSELFIVFNEQRDSFTPQRFPELENRAFVVKINRLFRF